MTTEQAKVQEAQKFLRTALKDGPRLAMDVMRESRIYGIPDSAIGKASEQIGALGWMSSDGLMWEMKKV